MSFQLRSDELHRLASVLRSRVVPRIWAEEWRRRAENPPATPITDSLSGVWPSITATNNTAGR